MDDTQYRRPKSNSSKKRSRYPSDNGRRKKPNSRQEDMSSKPIETLYRILCPVKKIGSVLGRGGDIINALRDETNAKIRVADAIARAEERVIIIFNYVSELSGELESAQDPDIDNSTDTDLENMKPHCPAQDALLKVHDRIAADELLHGGSMLEKNDPDGVTARILVPNNQVGCLLGKGGSVIQKLRSDTGAGIRILPTEHLPPCAMSTDELVQISGTPSLVRKALYEISSRLHEHPRKEHPPLEDIIHASTGGAYESYGSFPPAPPHGNPVWPHQHSGVAPPMPWDDVYRNKPFPYGAGGYGSGHMEPVEEFSIRILCAAEKISGVIGKGGVSVRQLEQQTGARIQVDDISPEAEERVIVISSKEIPSDPISPTIDALLQLQSKTCATSDKGIVTTRLLVPSSKVGCILGEGGKIINEMRRRTRADIRVYSKEDKPTYTTDDEELVQVSGNPMVAREALVEVASRLRTRTFRGGSTAANPAPHAPFPDFPPADHPRSRELPLAGSPAINNALLNSSRGYAPQDSYSSRGLPPQDSYSSRGLPPQDSYSSRGLPPQDSYSSGGLPPQDSYSSRGLPPQDSFSGRGLQPSTMTRPGNSIAYDHMEGLGQVYEEQGYARPPTAATGYTNTSNSLEVRIPSSVVESIVGVGRTNLSEIRQISGARVDLLDPQAGSTDHVVEINGSSDQVKAAQSLLHAFISTNGGQNAPSAQAGPWSYTSPTWR